MSVSGFLSSIAFNEATMRAKIALAKKSLAETRRVVTELKSLRGVTERDFAVRVPDWPYKATEPPYAFDEPAPPDIVPWDEIPENRRRMYTYNDGSGWKGPSQEVYDFVDANAPELNAAINSDRDRSFEFFGLRTVYDRYLLRHPERRDVIETPLEVLDLPFWINLYLTIGTKPAAGRLYTSLDLSKYDGKTLDFCADHINSFLRVRTLK